MKSFIRLAVFIFCIPYIRIFAQQPQEQWIKTYNYSTTSNQQSWAISTDDNGYIYVGIQTEDDTSSRKIVVLKYNQDGNIIWKEIFDNPYSGSHELYDLSAAGNGDVYVLGRDYNSGKWEIIKYDMNGNLQWIENPFKGGQPWKLRLDHNNNIIVTGWTVDSVYDRLLGTAKYDPDGNLLWKKTILPSVLSYGTAVNDIKIDSKNNVYLGATLARDYYTGSYNYDSYLLKYNSAGQLKWQRVYSIDTTDHYSTNQCSSISIDNSDNIYFISYGESPYAVPQYRGFAVQKYDSSGNLEWTKQYENGSFATASTISNNNVIVAAELNYSDTTESVIVEYNGSGKINWAENWNTSSNRQVFPQNVLSDASGNVYVTGFARIDSLGYNTDVFALKLNGATGDTSWSALYSSVPDSNQDESIVSTLDKYNDLIIDGYTYAEYDNTLAPTFVIKYSLGPTGIKNEQSNIIKSFKLYQNYPNPFNPSTSIRYSLPESSNIKIEIYNVLGIKIKTLVNRFKHSGNYKVKWNADGFASGIYFYRLQAGSYVKTKKMLLLK